jgi:hypothetical protein
LELCSTFADFAATEIELRDFENAEKSIAHAEQGYETISRFLP